MKRKLNVFEFALGLLGVFVGVVTGVSLVGKPLRLVDVILILALGVAGGVALTKAIIRFRCQRKQDSAPDTIGRDA